MKDLLEAAAENRDCIRVRRSAGENSGDVLERYRSRITEQFYPSRGFGKLNLGAVRRAIRDYRKPRATPPAP